MPELSSSGRRLDKKERNNQIERRLVAVQVQARLETLCRCGYVPQNWHEGSTEGNWQKNDIHVAKTKSLRRFYHAHETTQNVSTVLLYDCLPLRYVHEPCR